MQDGTAKNLIKLIIIALLWLTTTSYATELTNEALIKALRAGGYTLYFRHEATNWSQDDYIDKREDWLSCDPAKVRQLSEQGRQQASATGKAIRSLGIPVSRVLASPYCRTVETAKLMNLGAVQPSNDVINLRVASYFGGRNAIVKTARKLLSKPTDRGANTVVVAHGNVAQAATPVYPGEGEGVVFRANGEGGFDFIGRLTPRDWLRLSSSMAD